MAHHHEHTHSHDHNHAPSCSGGCGHAHGHSHGEKDSRTMVIRIVLSLALLIGFHFLPAEGTIRFVLFLVPYLIAGWDILKEAGENIIHGQVFDENFLMSLATIGAFAIGEYPEGVFVMIFYQVGELFQDRAVEKSRASITQLMDLCPDYANVENKEDGTLIQADPKQLAPGAVIVVKPGEKIPLDGVIISGASSLDTSSLTGESAPRDVALDDTVLSGCINLTGLLRVKVTKAYEDSTVAKILELVEHSASGKAKTERFITRFARYYTPIVVLCALALAVIPPLFLGDWSGWIHRALIFLVISCPCALVISVPLTFFSGIGGASSQGILIKGSNYLEALSRCEIVAFDKTGTLTDGTFHVASLHPAHGASEEELLAKAAAAECYSDHPIALSLRKALGREIERNAVTDTEVLAGKGVRAVVKGATVYAGNRRLMEGLGIHPEEETLRGTLVYVVEDGRYLGCISIADQCKEDAPQAVSGLKRLGVKMTAMLTGDSESSARVVGDVLGLDQVYSSLLPDQKVACMETLMKQKGEKGTLVYAGDGINDAPVLTLADVGIAMGALGSDAAIEAADVVLMEDKPSAICTAIRISRKTMVIVRQNIVFSIGIKALVMVLGAIGIVSMWAAVLADVGVCVVCVLNGMRALGVKHL